MTTSDAPAFENLGRHAGILTWGGVSPLAPISNTVGGGDSLEEPWGSDSHSAGAGVSEIVPTAMIMGYFLVS